MINEIFECLQGEGKTIGQPRLLIRFNGCNLSCDFCDTKYTWGKGDQQLDINKYDELLKKNKYWMITGGEPMLFQQEIIDLIYKYGPLWIEIETNGTIKATKELIEQVDLFNISPKEKHYQIKECNVEPILLEQRFDFNDYIIKFVIEDKEGLKFVNHIINKYSYGMIKSKVFLMPLSYFNKEQDEAKRKEIYNLALKEKFNFCPRLHVFLFGKERDK